MIEDKTLSFFRNSRLSREDSESDHEEFNLI